MTSEEREMLRLATKETPVIARESQEKSVSNSYRATRKKYELYAHLSTSLIDKVFKFPSSLHISMLSMNKCFCSEEACETNYFVKMMAHIFTGFHHVISNSNRGEKSDNTVEGFSRSEHSSQSNPSSLSRHQLGTLRNLFKEAPNKMTFMDCLR